MSLIVASQLLHQRSAHTFDVTTFGALGDGTSNDGPAIGRAFTACAQNGGGTVRFPPGQYITGPWNITCNNSVISIEAGAVVRAFTNNTGWPLGPRSPEPSQGLTDEQAAPFVLAHGMHNVTLTGGGQIDGSGESFWLEHCVRAVNFFEPTSGCTHNFTQSVESPRLNRPRLH